MSAIWCNRERTAYKYSYRIATHSRCVTAPKKKKKSLLVAVISRSSRNLVFVGVLNSTTYAVPRFIYEFACICNLSVYWIVLCHLVVISMIIFFICHLFNFFLVISITKVTRYTKVHLLGNGVALLKNCLPILRYNYSNYSHSFQYIIIFVS